MTDGPSHTGDSIEPRTPSPAEAGSVTLASDCEQANIKATSVTRGPVSAAERMRQYRARRREAAIALPTPLMYERDDWQLFVDQATLPQKAGCLPEQLFRAALKELVDNALDNGCNVTLERLNSRTYIIRDHGPGIDAAEVPKLFAVNRPLLSSKLKRLPLRGMLGNGLRVVMGAVAAYKGSIAVTTRGHYLVLAVDSITGKTSITSDTPAPVGRGIAVEISLPWGSSDPSEAAKTAIEIAKWGERTIYGGYSHPRWYSPADLHRLLANVRPETTRVDALVRDVFGINLHDPRIARNLDQDGAAALYGDLCRLAGKPPAEIGCIGPMQKPHYARVADHALINGARIPFTAEAWVTAARAEARGEGSVSVTLLLNRSPCLAASVHGDSYSSGLSISGSELRCRAQGAKTADYDITISLIAPYVQLTSDGKSPALAAFNEAIGKAVSKATTAAYRAIARPPKKMSIKDSAWEVMEWAYLKASANPGRLPPHLPANARQIMYAARPKILALTGVEKFIDSYFTQNLLPDFVEANPRLCANWDVVFDARGHFREPHTGRTVPLGTIEVRSYLGDRPHLGPSVTLNANDRYPTSGPANRYRNILFIEKEGFGPLLQAAQIAERFDIAIMSTKGMSVTASRMLLDRLAAQIDQVLVLHDFDIAGFSIFGTLAKDGRRYVYKNPVNMVDLGLRLPDIGAMALQSEPVAVGDRASRAARVQTLRRHGASQDEIEFLTGDGYHEGRRVELNAMTSRQFVDFIERKLAEHGVQKVVPDAEIIDMHARRLIEQRLAHLALTEFRRRLAIEAAGIVLPDDIEVRLRDHLAQNPTAAWDDALARIIGEPPLLAREGGAV